MTFSQVYSQDTSKIPILENIVPNSSFEEFASFPLGWFYNGKDYSRLMKYWTSPTYASPDIYHPKVRIPIFWTQKGFGIERPHQGKSMSGITTYGCEGGKPHCREYIQIQLIEPLVIGQQYEAEFYTLALERSIFNNNLGMYFSMEEINDITDEVLERTPQVVDKKVISATKSSWYRVHGTFTATEAAEYLLIGNFFQDSLTLTHTNSKSYNYGYYYIDDVKVKKIEPIIDVEPSENDICCLEYEVGKSVVLNNIFFETDKSELLPQSYVELNKLYQVLLDYPKMIIEIQGHTDNQGTHKYNINLSTERAQAVVDFLTQKGIDSSRLYFKGFGDTLPISDNGTSEGRQLNRRVEFYIMSM